MTEKFCAADDRGDGDEKNIFKQMGFSALNAGVSQTAKK
jgi:hypothetical protein